MRLIDADEIKLEKGFFENINNVPKFFEWLGKQPTIELVKHGRWTYKKVGGWKCSECGVQAPFWCFATTQNLSNYCHNCGAKMDEVDDDT